MLGFAGLFSVGGCVCVRRGLAWVFSFGAGVPQVRWFSRVLLGFWAFCLWSFGIRRSFQLFVRGDLASSAAFGFFVRGGLAYGVLLGLTGRLTGARLYDGFIF